MGVLVGMVRKEGARLNALVQQVLDLSRLEREGAEPRLAEADLADLVREAVERFAARAAAAGVDLAVADGSAASLVVRCDATLVAQALANLVENALRHSGSPTIRVSCGRSGKVARLVVEDVGRGVPADEAARIFERFHRVDPARAAESGGAGLGLAIVRRIAKLHGGEAACEPVSPHGARFVVTLKT
jgi:signal transduction histidine kinase